MWKSTLRRTFVFSLCLGLLIPLLPSQVEAQTITLDIGQPNVWSLAQAHYLLASMRYENRGLHAKMPADTDLNPNSINGARLDILRTFLGIETDINSVAGAQNRAALQGFEQSMARRQEAQTRVSALTQEYLSVVREISDLGVQLAQLGPAPTGNQQEEPQTARMRKELTDKLAARTPVRDALLAQINADNGILNAQSPTLSGFSSQTSPTPPTSSMNDDLKDLMGKLVSGSSSPALNASTALDNFIQMQYEIIAKQLTLLRDEVGPDQRLIFLEIPSSLYSVPKQDDNFIVQMKWNVHSYFGTCSDINTAEDADEDGVPEMGNNADKNKTLGMQQDEQKEEGNHEQKQRLPITIDAIETLKKWRAADRNLIDAYQPFVELQEPAENASERQALMFDLERRNPETAKAIRRLQSMSEQERQDIKELSEFHPDDYSAKFNDMVWRPVSNDARKTMHDPCPNVLNQSKFRIVDIIPRQSALNINDTHATQSGFALAAKFLSVFGFGGAVSYQRQRDIYEQFIHQDVFASGFGKGLDEFGWTIGPVPGTKRLAPGPRTTFAILAIPRGAVTVTLEADASAFRNNRAPDDASAKPLVTQKQFTILVPQRDTEGFWVDSAVYTPAPSGQRVTVLLHGKYFSPLTGVTVDGLALRRAVALAKHESEQTTDANDQSSPGEFEYLNPHELILSFKMSPSYVGTPLITLITPEKTSAINFFKIFINYRRRPESLFSHSNAEPMFIGSFGLTGLQGIERSGNTISAQLTGSGFRRGAQVLVNRRPVSNPRFVSTSVYDLSFTAPPDTEQTWVITYRLDQQQASVNYVPAVDDIASISPSIDGIENPSTGKPEGLTEGGEYVIIRGHNLNYIEHALFGTETAQIDTSRRHPNVLFVKVPKGKEGGVRVLLEGHTSGGQEVSNILDFQTPGKAIYKYVPKPKEEKPKQPQKQSNKKPKLRSRNKK